MRKKRRIGTKAELVEESSRYEGIYKFDVTYQDVNGVVVTKPEYAKNMTEAIRKVNRLHMMEDFKSTIRKYLTIAIFVMVIIAVITTVIIMYN